MGGSLRRLAATGIKPAPARLARDVLPPRWRLPQPVFAPPPRIFPGHSYLSFMFHVCMLDHVALLVFLLLIYSHKHIKGTGDTAHTQHTKHNARERMVNLKGQRSAEGDNLHHL